MNLIKRLKKSYRKLGELLEKLKRKRQHFDLLEDEDEERDLIFGGPIYAEPEEDEVIEDEHSSLLDKGSSSSVEVETLNEVKTVKEKRRLEATAILGQKARKLNSNSKAVRKGLLKLDQDTRAEATVAIEALGVLEPTQIQGAIRQFLDAQAGGTLSSTVGSGKTSLTSTLSGETRAEHELVGRIKVGLSGLSAEVKQSGHVHAEGEGSLSAKLGAVQVDSSVKAQVDGTESVDATLDIGLDKAILGLQVLGTLGVDLKGLASIEGGSRVQVSLIENQILDTLTRLELEVHGEGMGYAEAHARVKGRMQLGLKGIALEAYAKAEAKAHAQVEGRGTFSVGALGVEVSALVSATAEASATAGGTFVLEPSSGRVEMTYTFGAEAEASVGTGTGISVLLMSRKIITQRFVVKAAVGAGSKSSGGFVYRDGKLVISWAASGALEVGGGVDLETEINVLGARDAVRELAGSMAAALNTELLRRKANGYELLEDDTDFRVAFEKKLRKMGGHNVIVAMVANSRVHKGKLRLLSEKRRRKGARKIRDEIGVVPLQSAIDGLMASERYAAIYSSLPDEVVEVVVAAIEENWNMARCLKKAKRVGSFSASAFEIAVIVAATDDKPVIRSLKFPTAWTQIKVS